MDYRVFLLLIPAVSGHISYEKRIINTKPMDYEEGDFYEFCPYIAPLNLKDFPYSSLSARQQRHINPSLIKKVTDAQSDCKINRYYKVTPTIGRAAATVWSAWADLELVNAFPEYSDEQLRRDCDYALGVATESDFMADVYFLDTKFPLTAYIKFPHVVRNFAMKCGSGGNITHVEHSIFRKTMATAYQYGQLFWGVKEQSEYITTTVPKRPKSTPKKMPTEKPKPKKRILGIRKWGGGTL